MNKYFQLLGLAMKAGKVHTGEKALESVKSGEAKLVLLASDASERTKKKVKNKCTFYHVNVVSVDDSIRLSHSIGKTNCMIIAICDEGFAERLEII